MLEDKVEVLVVREKAKGIIKKVLKVCHPYIAGAGSGTSPKQYNEKEEESRMDESIRGWYHNHSSSLDTQSSKFIRSILLDCPQTTPPFVSHILLSYIIPLYRAAFI